mmetsp:Transcript_115028/g.330473  ORF Transcript_115028/g.330473 Transcript_115028/m.330473 type:complete len:107 (+) Transcript_115028:153-473(+)
MAPKEQEGNAAADAACILECARGVADTRGGGGPDAGNRNDEGGRGAANEAAELRTAVERPLRWPMLTTAPEPGRTSALAPDVAAQTVAGPQPTAESNGPHGTETEA